MWTCVKHQRWLWSFRSWCARWKICSLKYMVTHPITCIIYILYDLIRSFYFLYKTNVTGRSILFFFQRKVVKLYFIIQSLTQICWKFSPILTIRSLVEFSGCTTINALHAFDVDRQWNIRIRNHRFVCSFLVCDIAFASNSHAHTQCAHTIIQSTQFNFNMSVVCGGFTVSSQCTVQLA